MSPSVTSLFGVALCAALVLAPSAPVEAQARLGSRLDDPTGHAPIRTQPPPFAGDSVPAPPGYVAGVPDPRASGRGAVDHGADHGEVAPPNIAFRLRALDATWATLGARGVNYTNSVLSLVLGAGQIVIGGAMLEAGPDLDALAPIFFVTGSVQIVRTVVVDFVLRPNPQPISLEYASMPSGTHAQQLARLRYGEEQLEAIAEQSMILRFVDSGFNVAGAAALVGAYLGLRPDRAFEPFELIFFIGPGISTVIAVINLFNQSDAERRWDAYQQLRERLGGDLGAVQLEPVLSADPRGGGYVGLRATY